MPQIPQDEWRRRKDRILELYRGPNGKLLGPGGVIQTMETEGFIATKSQYEVKFRAWGVRKYVKKSEWQGGQIPPNIMISDTRERRALRRYAPKTQQARELVTRQNGHAAQGSISSLISLENVSVGNFAAEVIMPATERDNRAINPTFYPDTDGINSDPNIFLRDLTTQGENHLPMEAYQPPGNDPSSNQLTASDFRVSSPDESGSLQRITYLLPSIKIADQLIADIFSKTSATPASFTLATHFLDDIKESLQTTRSSSSSSVNAGYSPVTFQPARINLLFQEPFVGEEKSQLDTLNIDHIPTARLHARLIGSIVNGTTDLKDIPAAGVIRFLTTRGAVPLWLFQFLTSSPTHMAKSLAENLFQKALEADHVDLIKLLLNCGALEDVHEIVCHYNGKRYTPLQIAAMKQSYGVAKFLIRKKKVDVNKTFLSRSVYPYHALDMLVEHNHTRHFTLDDKFLDLVDAFLAKNARVSARSIKSALRVIDPRLASRLIEGSTLRVIDPRLAIRLIEKSAFQVPQSLISDSDILIGIIENLEEEDATSMIKLLIEQCLKIGGDGSLFRFSSPINNALEVAAKREYKGVAETLFPYTSSPDQILRKATKFGNQKMIDFILQKHPGLNQGAKRAKDDVIAALRSGDQDCLRSLEERGILKRLQSKHKLGEAFKAVLEAGNLEYATKIMDLDPDFEFADDVYFDLAAALRIAMTHGFDDIAWKLLAIGTTINRIIGYDTDTSLLYIAVSERKPEFVKAIIESGFIPNFLNKELYRGYLVLEAAIEWGDNSILNDIWQAHSGTIDPSSDVLELALKKGRQDIFWKIMESSPPGSDAWQKRAVEVAIKCEDIPLLETLVARGASVADDGLLEDAITYHPSMAKPLLEQFRKVYPEGRAGYGRDSIVSAIRDYPKSSMRLDMLFDENIVTTDILQGDGESETPLFKAIRHCRLPDTSLVERLLVAGRDINERSDVNSSMRDISTSKDYEKTTALLKAIEIESTVIIELLIEHKARVNEPARFGIRCTPLQKAAEINNLEIVRLLLNNGADVNAAPAKFEGATALQFAAIHGNVEMAITLLQSRADLNIPPPQGPRGRWPLEGAAEHGRLDMIQLLWNKNNPFNDEQCRNAMRRAERNGHMGCRDLIKELMAT